MDEIPARYDETGAHDDQPDIKEVSRDIVMDLGQLPEATILTERAVASMFGRSQSSVVRSVRRGELPPPTRLFGRPVWTVAVLVRHIEARLEASAKESRKSALRVARLGA